MNASLKAWASEIVDLIHHHLNLASPESTCEFEAETDAFKLNQKLSLNGILLFHPGGRDSLIAIIFTWLEGREWLLRVVSVIISREVSTRIGGFRRNLRRGSSRSSLIVRVRRLIPAVGSRRETRNNHRSRVIVAGDSAQESHVSTFHVSEDIPNHLSLICVCSPAKQKGKKILLFESIFNLFPLFSLSTQHCFLLPSPNTLVVAFIYSLSFSFHLQTDVRKLTTTIIINQSTYHTKPFPNNRN